MTGLMVAMLMVFFTYELGLVLWGVGHILRNESGCHGQNYVALLGK